LTGILAGDVSKGLLPLFAAAGLFVFVVGLTFAVKKFSVAIARRDAALDKLREAYRDLEAAKPLRELGRSAAFINHEIKNCMMVISGYAALMLRSKKLDERDRAMAGNIATAVAKLHDFSVCVMELSQSKTKNDGEEFELAQRLRSCIDANFAERASGISVNYGAPLDTLFLNGNPEKLERAIMSALHNSFEAGAQNISLRLSVCNQTALIVIEDDGAGCGAAQLPNLSTAFFTTKRGIGTGLGLCVIRSTVEARGGSVSIYTKNVLGGGKHGLLMQILLPAGKKTPCAAARAEVILVKDSLSGIQVIMDMLRNLKIIPRTAGQVRDIVGKEQNSSSELLIIADASKAAELRELAVNNGKINTLLIEEAVGGVLLAVTDGDTGNRELFTEEYMINRLCGS